MMMPAKVLGGSYYQFDSWQGYPQEREELLAHIKDRAIDDVIFITGDIHLFLAGDVRTNMGDGESVALEFVGGSITSTNFGEMDFDAGGGVVIHGNDADPATDPAIFNALRGINPWIDQGDLDHHGYATVEASRTAFDVTLQRLETIKRRSRATLPAASFSYRVAPRPEVDQGRQRAGRLASLHGLPHDAAGGVERLEHDRAAQAGGSACP